MAELQALITAHYSTRIFTVGPGGDNPEGIHLTARADLDDPDAVLVLVIERVLELPIQEHLPSHVVPVRSEPRVEQLVKQRQTDLAPTFPLPDRSRISAGWAASGARGAPISVDIGRRLPLLTALLVR